MDPFDNTVVTFTVSGRTLRKILQSTVLPSPGSDTVWRMAYWQR
jgi:hypothetical protein